jgi:hypothetical protein
VQQINLYQENFKKNEPKYSAAIIVIVLGYAVFIGLAVSLGIYGSSVKESNYKQNLKEQSLFWTDQLEIAYRQHPEPKIDGVLLKSIEGYETQILRNENVLKYLSERKEIVKKQELSIYLDALTQVRQENLWLTKVAIKKGGTSLTITGRTIEANSLPEYLKKVSDLDIFKSMQFEVFDLKRIDKEMRFVVSSEKQEESVEDFFESAKYQN